MNQTLLYLSYASKALGLLASLNVIPFVSPAHGVIIFFIASLGKDTVNRIGDFIDGGKSDWRSAIAFLAIFGFALGGATGCTSLTGQTFTYTPAGAATPITITGFGAWCENNLTIIRAAVKSTVLITAQVFIKQGTTAARIASYVKDAEAAIQPLLGQSTVSQADLEQALSQVKVSDPSGIYADAIEPAITLIGGYIVELQSDGAPTKVTIDVLIALNGGLSDASTALDPTTASAFQPVARDSAGSLVYSF